MSAEQQHMREHQELVSYAERILGMVRDHGVECAAEFAQARLKFARLVIAHCDGEAVTIRNAVKRGDVSAEVAARFRHELMMWRTALAECNSQWTAQRALAEPTAFSACFGLITRDLKSFIVRENRDILVVIVQRYKASSAEAASHR